MTRNMILTTSFMGCLAACILIAVPAVFAGKVVVDNFDEVPFDVGPKNSNQSYFIDTPGSGNIAGRRHVTLGISGGPSDWSSMAGGDGSLRVNFTDSDGGTSSGSFATIGYAGFSADVTGGGTENGLEIVVSSTSATAAAPMQIRSDMQWSNTKQNQVITGAGTYRYPFADYSNPSWFDNTIADMNFLVFAHNSGPGGGTADITIESIHTYVPEPATGLLALVGLLALPFRRRR